MLNMFSLCLTQSSNRLTLTELEATTCLGLTGLLALHLAAVAGEESLNLEGLLVIGVHLDKGAGDSHAQGLALTSETATVEVGLDVILLGALQQSQGLLHHTAGLLRGNTR